MSTSRKKSNRSINESPILKAFAASTGSGATCSRNTKESNAETHSLGASSSTSVIQPAEPSQSDVDVIEQHTQLPTKKKKLIPVASRYTWLKRYATTGGYLCTSCIDAHATGLLFLHPSSKGSWVQKPMLKIDNVQQKAEKHESSQQHQEAVALLTGAQPTVGVVFEQIQRKEADASGKYFPIVMASAYMLLKNEIPHTTNLQDMLSTMCYGNEEFKQWLQSRPANATYLSSNVVTSILEAFGEEIRQCVYGKIKKSVEVFDAFVFLGDESEDHSHIERASHVVRYLEPETGEIQESFVGLQPLKTTDSAAILEQAQ